MQKHLKSSELKKYCDVLHTRGKRIVFTLGTYDLIHSGHAAYLLHAKSYGDVLIVGVASNKSKRKLRGKGFPLIDQKNRAELIEYFRFVDNTVFVDEQDLLPILKKIKPDVFFTLGVDWRSHLRKVGESGYVKRYGGKVIKAPRTQPFVSSSAIVERVADLKIKEVVEYFFGKVQIDLSKGNWKQTQWSGLKTDVRTEALDFGVHSRNMNLFSNYYFGEILSNTSMKKLGDKLRKSGKKIVLSSGACDLLHAGHARFYARARSLGDVLVLAIPSNATIRKQKGRGRPIVDEYSRAELMAFFDFVDYVTIFDDDSILPVLNDLRPDVFFTVQEDWNQVEDSPVIESMNSWGGKVHSVPPQSPKLSSSKLIRKAAGLRVRQVFREVLEEAEKWDSLKG